MERGKSICRLGHAKRTRVLCSGVRKLLAWGRSITMRLTLYRMRTPVPISVGSRIPKYKLQQSADKWWHEPLSILSMDPYFKYF